MKRDIFVTCPASTPWAGGPLSPVVGVTVEGDQLPPGGQVRRAEIADGVSGGLLYSNKIFTVRNDYEILL